MLESIKDNQKGEVITKNMLESLRPCPDDAFRPYEIDKILGKKVNIDIDYGQEIKKTYLEN